MSCCNFGNRRPNYPRGSNSRPRYDSRRGCEPCRPRPCRGPGFCPRRGSTLPGFGRLF